MRHKLLFEKKYSDSISHRRKTNSNSQRRTGSNSQLSKQTVIRIKTYQLRLVTMKSKIYFVKKKINPNSKRRKKDYNSQRRTGSNSQLAKQTKLVSKDTNSDS